MVPVEWPIDAPARYGGRVTARAAGSRRLPSVRSDFFLDPQARLTEQERSLMTTMLADLVAMLGDEFTSLLSDTEPANAENEQLLDQLWSAGLLDIPDLVALLLRRAEGERISAGLRPGIAGKKPRLLQALVSDDDPEVSAAAMALILAKGRRRDRFDGPRLTFDDVSAEAAAVLANSVAAARRSDLAKRLGPAQADERLTDAAQALLARHDERNRLEAKLFTLGHALHRSGRLDDALVHSALEEGEAFLLAEILALKAGLTLESAWEHFTGGSGKLPLLLRMGEVSRDLLAEIITRCADLLGLDPESEISAFDQLSDDQVESARKWFRLDPAYRFAVSELAFGNG